MTERVMKAYEVAEKLGVSVDFVRRRFRAFENGDPDGIPGFRLAGPRSAVGFSESELDAWLRRNRSAQPPLRSVNG